MTWILTFLFAATAYGLGAMTGKRCIGGVLSGFYAFIAYMLPALAGLSFTFETLNYGSPFYDFNSPSVLKLDSISETLRFYQEQPCSLSAWLDYIQAARY